MLLLPLKSHWKHAPHCMVLWKKCFCISKFPKTVPAIHSHITKASKLALKNTRTKLQDSATVGFYRVWALCMGFADFLKYFDKRSLNQRIKTGVTVSDSVVWQRSAPALPSKFVTCYKVNCCGLTTGGDTEKLLPPPGFRRLMSSSQPRQNYWVNSTVF